MGDYYDHMWQEIMRLYRCVRQLESENARLKDDMEVLRRGSGSAFEATVQVLTEQRERLRLERDEAIAKQVYMEKLLKNWTGELIVAPDLVKTYRLESE